jgi:hypothetical protein
MTANTKGTQTWREKYRSSSFQTFLKNAIVAPAVCQVDTSNDYLIKDPYGSTPTVTVQALTGTYSIDAWTTTNDYLTVTDEFIVAEHVFDFESLLGNFNMMANRIEQQTYALAVAVDNWVLNNLCEDGTGSYTTPTGGFTTAANILTILANLNSKWAGYANAFQGAFLVIENTDLVGFQIAQATNGFSTADAALKNGKITSMMGIDIYVVRTGTFADATTGTKTYTNSGHRVAGIKGIATYAQPRGVTFDEKGVSGKTGKEICGVTYAGFKLWTAMAAMIIDITIA